MPSFSVDESHSPHFGQLNGPQTTITVNELTRSRSVWFLLHTKPSYQLLAVHISCKNSSCSLTVSIKVHTAHSNCQISPADAMHINHTDSIP